MPSEAPDSTKAVRVSHLPSLYFLHIPKAAGTSFRLWLMRLFGTDDFLPIDHLGELEALAAGEICGRRLASGHFGWRLMERAEEIGESFEPVTLLREPVDHVLSGFRFTSDIAEEEIEKLGGGADRHRIMNETIESAFNDASLSQEEQLEKFLTETADIEDQFRNITTRFLALNGTEDPAAPAVGAAELDLARQRLDGMRFFGLVEDWEGTATLFADAFGLPLRAMDYRHNRSSGAGPAVGSAFLDAVRRMHGLDLELFDYARASFRERLAAVRSKFGLAPDAGFDDFKPVLLRQFLETDRGLARLSEAIIPLSAGIIQDGFERRYPSDPDRWRLWSGPGKEGTIYLPLDRSRDLSLRFTVDVFLGDRIRDGMRISVDSADQEIKKTFVQVGEGWRVHLDVPVPANADGRQYSAITFTVPEVVPQETEALAPATAFALGGEIVVTSAADRSDRPRVMYRA